MTPIKLCYRKTMIQSSSALEIAAPRWLILLITSLRVSTTVSPLSPNIPDKKRRGLRVIRSFVITKVLRSETNSPTALDIQKETCRTGADSHIAVLSVCTLFSGGGRRLCGFPEQHLPALELPPNESQQSPQSPAPALTLFPSLIAVAMFNHKMTLPPPPPLPLP